MEQPKRMDDDRVREIAAGIGAASAFSGEYSTSSIQQAECTY